MKKFLTLIILFALIGNISKSYAAVRYTVVQDGCNPKLLVYANATTNYNVSPLNRWSLGKFTIRWPQSYGQTILTSITGQNGFSFYFDGLVNADGSNYYQVCSFTSLNVFNMTAGNAYLIATIDLAGTGFGDFEYPGSANLGVTPASNINNPAGNQNTIPYNSSSALDVNMEPMVIWNAGAWCGGSGTGGAPSVLDGTLPCYVKAPGAVIGADAQVASLTVRPGADITVNSFFDIYADILLQDNGSTQGFLTINPSGSVTAGGATTLSVASQLKVLADATGPGSFIDNGTINHGAGSADVQIWINNTAGGNYYWHLVGPTVKDPAYTGPGAGGVYLGAFELPISTYAFAYNEAGAGSWLNVYNVTDPISTGSGLALSTAESSTYTLTMTGHLATGPIATVPMGFGGANLALLSNPYASAVDFNSLWANNSGVINNKKYEWIPGGVSDYGVWTVNSGGTNGVTKDVQVGQAFFVETTAASAFNFDNSVRLHSTSAFYKDSYIDRLLVRAEGNNYSDESIIHFYEGAEFEYGHNTDAYKWNSMDTEATEIWTVANDQSLLSVNAMPPLGSGVVSVPLSFKCSATGTYILTALDVASFESGTEIYLEDLATGSEWVDLVSNPVYTFTATAEDEKERFIIHFLGPTGINDPDDAKLITIYSWSQDAYIVNRGKETIKEYVAYDLMGRELHRGTLPNSTLNKVQIGEVSGYYIVKVITKEGRIYTDKVYITK